MKRQLFLNVNAKIGARDAVKSAEQIMQEQHDKYNALLASAEAAESALEIERMRLAGCSVAALGYFTGCADEYKSASLSDVLDLRADYDKLRKEFEDGPKYEYLGKPYSRRMLEDENKRLREALGIIEEYWNRDNNEKAMHDACWHAVDTAHSALNGGGTCNR